MSDAPHMEADGSPAGTWRAADLAALAREAWQLEPPMPHERKGVLRDEAALLVDRLLVRVARGRGALELAMGESLAELAVGDRALCFDYSGIGDYARERLGVAGRTALAMAQLARELRARPLLRQAVLRGEVSARKALTLLRVARGDAEQEWVERARSETVRALEAAARAANSETEREEDERWEPLCVPLSPEGEAKLDEAMALAGKMLGATAPKWQRLEVICQEFLGAHPVEPAPEDGGEERARALPRGAAADWLEANQEALEAETRRWEALAAVDAVEAPAVAERESDPQRLDERLRELAAMRARWDELFGHLGMLLGTLGLWRDLGFLSLGHYAVERLGMAPRTVEQRVWLERRLYALPALRQAMREGRLSYEKARLVAGCADEATLGPWIDRAERSTCVALRREIEAQEQKQMRARGELRLRLPGEVAALLDAAVRAARQAAGRWLTIAECLERICVHFTETHRSALRRRTTPQRRVLERDGGFCQVPGCSRAAVHAHHVRFKSRGGGDEPENITSLCAVHHLRGVHMGFIRVRGRAPDGLVWELGSARLDM